ncbi:hypothetical protein VNO77_43871 [Canavalia gladiata]|uniref:Uncharacterized protein n=1 Tax=Canavalia gladiata TaxID=3824 RepID=A0AAN9PQF7_CANGL
MISLRTSLGKLVITYCSVDTRLGSNSSILLIIIRTKWFAGNDFPNPQLLQQIDVFCFGNMSKKIQNCEKRKFLDSIMQEKSHELMLTKHEENLATIQGSFLFSDLGIILPHYHSDYERMKQILLSVILPGEYVVNFDANIVLRLNVCRALANPDVRESASFGYSSPCLRNLNAKRKKKSPCLLRI